MPWLTTTTVKISVAIAIAEQFNSPSVVILKHDGHFYVVSLLISVLYVSINAVLSKRSS